MNNVNHSNNNITCILDNPDIDVHDFLDDDPCLSPCLSLDCTDVNPDFACASLPSAHAAHGVEHNALENHKEIITLIVHVIPHAFELDRRCAHYPCLTTLGKMLQNCTTAGPQHNLRETSGP